MRIKCVCVCARERIFFLFITTYLREKPYDSDEYVVQSAHTTVKLSFLFISLLHWLSSQKVWMWIDWVCVYVWCVCVCARVCGSICMQSSQSSVCVCGVMKLENRICATIVTRFHTLFPELFVSILSHVGGFLSCLFSSSSKSAAATAPTVVVVAAAASCRCYWFRFFITVL